MIPSIADLLLAMHLHGSAALENAAILSHGILSPPTNPPNTSYFSDAPVQRRQSSPAERSPYGHYGNSNNGVAPPPLPPMPFPSILTATPRTLSRLRALLSSWHFEPYLLSPPETLLCVQLIFEALLGALQLTISKPSDGEPAISMATHLVPFLTDLMRLYRRENRYHSFVHALDVLQAVYTFLELQGRVESVAVAFLDGEDSSVAQKSREGETNNPLALLNDDDLFLLCLAAIGHDVGHPGNSNAFLVRRERNGMLLLTFFV